MNEDLLKKLTEERPLTPEEALELDQALESPGQAQAAAWVRGLSAPEPSMAWRSALNRRLARPARRRTVWLWGSAAATVTALSALLAVALHQAASGPSAAGPGPSVEQALVDTHRQSLVPVSTDSLRSFPAHTAPEWVDVEAL